MATFFDKLRYGKQYGYEVLFKNQDPRATGKTGVIIAEMGLPEVYETSFYSDFMEHVFDYSLPGFLKKMILADKGMGLIDPENPLAREKFSPRRLIDSNGSFTNQKGVPYTQCAYQWKPPIKKNPWDHGYFVYTGDGPNGFPDVCDKVGAKIVGWYYGSLIPEKRVSWRYQLRKVYDDAVDQLARMYPEAEFRNAHYMDTNSLRSAVDSLAAAGCATIVYQGINCPLYSDFEDYGYVLPLLHNLAGKRARVIMADQLGNQPAYRAAYVAMLRDWLQVLPQGSRLLVILSRHGHPFKKETQDARAHLYRDPLEADLRAVLADWNGNWEILWSFDEYADPYWDKTGQKLETYTAYRKAISEGYDFALELPTEFPAENTDLMIFHAMKKFHAFAEYDRNQPIPYPDWETPLVRQFHEGKTTGIYAGTPVGKYRKYIVEALVNSICDVL